MLATTIHARIRQRTKVGGTSLVRTSRTAYEAMRPPGDGVTWLEHHLHPELQLPRGRDRAGDPAGVRQRRLSFGGSGENYPVRHSEVCMIEQVEHFEPDLQAAGAAKETQGGVLHHRQVGHQVTGTGERIPWNVTKETGGLKTEPAGIEVVIRTAQDEIIWVDAGP